MDSERDERFLMPTAPSSPGLIALCGPDAVALALALTAQIGVRRPVWVIDGGNRFDALWLSDFVARRGLPPEPVLARIHISRAFTCHQMAERILSLPEEGAPAPLIVLHLLDTFYDEDVPTAEARRLLAALWPVLARLSRTAPVALTLSPPRDARVAERMRFYEGILGRADRCVGPAEEVAPAPTNLPLFPELAEPDRPRIASSRGAYMNGRTSGSPLLPPRPALRWTDGR